MSNMNSLVPLIYYPFKTLLVDDNADVLNSFEQILSHNFNIATTSTSQNAFDILEKSTITEYNLFNDITDKQELSLTKDTDELSTIQFTFDNIINIANDKSKYQQYGILITDYSMPEMNGIDLCNKIDHLPIMKILLTGKYDLSDAVHALNNKLIDCYIKKGEPDINEQLNFYTNQLMLKYFNNLTDTTLNTLGSDKLPFLFDTQFAELLNNTVKELQITEFYLINSYGSYLLANKHNRYVLVIYTEENLNEFCDSFSNEPYAAHFIESVRQKQNLPFFGIGVSPGDINFDNWEECFYPANMHHKYYWHLITL